jgi:HEAT repeat protein
LTQPAVTAKAIEHLETAPPLIRAELLRLLAARRARQAMPAVLRSWEAPEQTVRLAALEAARELASANDSIALIRMMASSKAPAEQSGAEAALLSVCAREPQACLKPVLDHLAASSGPPANALLRALAVIGGPEALRELSRACHSPDPPQREEALRLISEWPDAAAVPHLLKLAQEAKAPVPRVLALRGLIRLAGAGPTSSVKVEVLQKAWMLAERVEERRLVLGALGGVGSSAALTLALEGLKKPELAEESALAVIQVAEQLPAPPGDEARAALEQVLQLAKSPETQERAKQLLRQKR